MEVDKNIVLDRVPLQGLTGNEYYIALKTLPYLMETTTNQDPYSHPGYYLELLDKGQDVDNGIPILKIRRTPRRKTWELTPDYVLPVVSICAHRVLIEKLVVIQQRLLNIIGKLKEDALMLLQIKLLSLELANLSYNESPYKFVLLLKKICLVFQVYLENVFEVSELYHLRKFIDKQYNHNDVADILNLGLMCLEEMDQKAVVKVRVALPPPTPPPPPPPSPPPPPREILPEI
jgi:U5 snRNP spliceosome subunit